MVVVWWYFVCECGAKWFARHTQLMCPRCGIEIESTERKVPPWLLPIKS